MNVYLDEQAKMMLERCDVESCGVFKDDDTDSYVGWRVNRRNDLDVFEGDTFEEVWRLVVRL